MKFGILIKQDLKNIFSMPVLINFCLVYPIALVLILGFIFKTIYTTNTVSSFDYYGVTIMMFIVLNSVTIAPNIIMEESVKQGNIRISYAPVSRLEVCMSKLLSSYIFTGIAFSIDMIVLKALKIVNYGGTKFVYVWALYMAVLMMAITLGGAACTIIKNENLTNKILTFIIDVTAIFAGLFFPIDRLSITAGEISELCPIKTVTDSIFRIIYDGNTSGFILSMAVLIVM